jgi:hypothetical protein
MKTILENSLNAVESFVTLVDPMLGKSLREIISKGKFTARPEGRGQTVYRTFTLNSPIEPDLLKAISAALLEFSHKPSALHANVEGIGIYGAIQFWGVFISD